MRACDNWKDGEEASVLVTRFRSKELRDDAARERDNRQASKFSTDPYSDSD